MTPLEGPFPGRFRDWEQVRSEVVGAALTWFGALWINPTNLHQGAERRARCIRCITVQRYYFHLINDVDVRDEEGQTFPDVGAARQFAIRQARALIAAGAVDEGRIVLHHRIDIEDDRHALVESLHFRDAVTIEA